MADVRVTFDRFDFNAATGELRRNGLPVPLEHQPALLLAELLASPGRLVTRDELAAAIWRDGTHVKFDDGLNYCVRQLRAALGDDARSPRFIETIPRRGYRFVAGVRPAGAATARSRWVSMAAAAVLFAGAISWLEARPNNHHELAVGIARTIHDALY